jgi:amidase
MTKLAASIAIAIGVVASSLIRAESPRAISLDSATVADFNAAFDAGALTSEQLVSMSLARIRAYDRQGPMLRALITVNPKAIDVARQLDAERKAKGRRSPLHGIPVVLKDNIDTCLGLATVSSSSRMRVGWQFTRRRCPPRRSNCPDAAM